MSRRLRVLVVLGAGVVGGAEGWLFELLDATDRLEVSAIALADGDVVTALKMRDVPVTVVTTGRRAVDGLRSALHLRALLASEPCDVVLASDLAAAALVLPVAALVGVPTVWVRHDHGFGLPLARALGRLATRVVVTKRQVSTAASRAEELVQVLADAARRPGAGLTGPPISVVVTVRNEVGAVGPLVETLLPQLRADDEVVVVDGGSTDGTLQHLQTAAEFEARLIVVDRPGVGISEGRNIGIRAARWQVLACTDAGCEPVDGWLAELAAAFGEPDPPDLVTGVYRVTDPRPTWWGQALVAVGYPDPTEARRPTPLVRAYGALLGRVFDPALPTGRSMAFTREAWERVEGFPEHLATGEDVTFGQRIVATGGRAVLAAEAEVAWEQRATLVDNLQMYRSYGRGDGQTGSTLLVGRNLARAAAYPVGLMMLTTGSWRVRLAALAGAAGYLSLPAARTVGRDPSALPALAVLAGLRDGAKVWGCIEGLGLRRRSHRTRFLFRLDTSRRGRGAR